MALARIDALELMYRRGHEDAQRPINRRRTLSKTKVVRKRPRGGETIGPPSEQIEYETIDDGGEESTETATCKPDPRWANGIAWCIAERNKILGNYAEKEQSNVPTQVLVIIGEERVLTPPPLPNSDTLDIKNMLPSNIVFDEDENVPADDAVHSSHSGPAEPQTGGNGQPDKTTQAVIPI
jgi:hypothetical protein